MAGPNYTVDDLIYYMGMIGGIIFAFLGLGFLGLHPILRLVIGLVFGVGCGWLGLKLYSAVTGKRDDGPDGPI